MGFFNADNAGVVGFSLNRGHELSLHEVKELFNTAIDDARETFDGDIDVIDETPDQATGQELNTYENEEIPEVIITEE